MAFSTDGSSREAIQAIQFELWPDCRNGCSFCYLNGTRRITKLSEKRNNILNTLATLNDKAIMKDYNAVGLIGGDFFQGQLRGVENEWGKLIGKLEDLLQKEEIKEVWIAGSLLHTQINDIIGTLFFFNRSELKEGQRVSFCTSFDTIGRFKASPYGISEDGTKDDDSIVQESLDIWLNNVRFIKENYPNVNIHVQTILTQDVLEKLIENPNYFDFITDLGCIIDFRYPSISRADCPTATVIEDYRSLLMAKYQEFPEKFFIEDRSTFLRFLPIFAQKYGITKVENLLHQPEMRSRRLRIYVDNAEIEDRWNDERDVYLECGHLVDGLCYINDAEHCIYCDIEKFLENQESA